MSLGALAEVRVGLPACPLWALKDPRSLEPGFHLLDRCESYNGLCEAGSSQTSPIWIIQLHNHSKGQITVCDLSEAVYDGCLEIAERGYFPGFCEEHPVRRKRGIRGASRCLLSCPSHSRIDPNLVVVRQ